MSYVVTVQVVGNASLSFAVACFIKNKAPTL